MRRHFLGQMAALAAGAAAPRTFAQTPAFPERPIRVIIAFAPGGSVDPIMRVAQPRIGEVLGQALVLENRPGGTTSLAAGAVTKAPADGYTLLYTAANTHVLHTIGASHITYDPVADFTPIAALSRSGYTLAIHPSIPATTVAELVAYCKAHPGKLSFASTGIGNADHLSFERFNLATGIQTVRVPYKAAATAYLDLLAGRVQAYFTATPVTEPGIRAGKLRGLAYTVPENETQKNFAAAGLPELDGADSLNVLLGPPNLPAALVARLQSAVEKALAVPEVQAGIRNHNAQAYFLGSPQLRERLRSSLATYRRIIQEADIKLGG